MKQELIETVAHIAKLDADAADLIAALSEHIRNEPNAIRAGPLHRIRQTLVDTSAALRSARDKFAGTVRHSAALNLHAIGDDLRTLLSTAPDTATGAALSRIATKVKMVKAAI